MLILITIYILLKKSYTYSGNSKTIKKFSFSHEIRFPLRCKENSMRGQQPEQLNLINNKLTPINGLYIYTSLGL